MLRSASSDVLTGGVDLSGVPNGFSLNSIGAGSIGPIPVLVFVAGDRHDRLRAGTAHDRFGRYTYAIGSNDRGRPPRRDQGQTDT